MPFLWYFAPSFNWVGCGRVLRQRPQDPKDEYADWNCTTWSCSVLYCIPILSDSLKQSGLLQALEMKWALTLREQLRQVQIAGHASQLLRCLSSCCWELLRRHCPEQQGLPSHSLSSPAAGYVCPHVGNRSELGGYVRREAGGSDRRLVQPWLCSARVAEDTREAATQQPPKPSWQGLCKFSVSTKYFVFHPTLYVTRNFVLARRQLCFHISPVVSGDFMVFLL